MIFERVLSNELLCGNKIGQGGWGRDTMLWRREGLGGGRNPAGRAGTVGAMEERAGHPVVGGAEQCWAMGVPRP